MTVHQIHQYDLQLFCGAMCDCNSRFTGIILHCSSDGLTAAETHLRCVQHTLQLFQLLMVLYLSPTNVLQLHTFLGMGNYYAKFLPCPSSVLAPLYQLFQKNVRWSWGTEEDKVTPLQSPV